MFDPNSSTAFWMLIMLFDSIIAKVLELASGEFTDFRAVQVPLSISNIKFDV